MLFSLAALRPSPADFFALAISRYWAYTTHPNEAEIGNNLTAS